MAFHFFCVGRMVEVRLRGQNADSSEVDLGIDADVSKRP